MTVLEIFLFRGEQLLGSRVYSESNITIGRGSTNLLTLDDRQVSRLHATIVVDGARLMIRDEGSQIGTFLNGERIKESTFRETDSLTIGTFRLKIARRSMRSSLDFHDDEPTEAGQRRLLAQQEAVPSVPAPPPVQVAPSVLAALPVPAGAAPPSPLGETTALINIDPAPPPSVVVPSAHRTAADSPREELIAGLEDQSQIYLLLPSGSPAGAIPRAASGSAASGPAPTPAPAANRLETEFAEFVDDAATIHRSGGPPAQVPPAGAPASLPTMRIPVLDIESARPADAVRVAAWDEAEDDDDDAFEPSFSLLDLLDKDPVTQEGATLLQLEIIHHREGRIINVHQISSKTNFPNTGRRLVRFEGDSRAQLAVTEEVSGIVYLNSRAIPLEEIRRGARDRKGVALLEMREGDQAAVVLTRPASAATQILANEYHIRFVRVPDIRLRKAEQLSVRLFSTASGYGWLFGAVAFHMLILFGLSLLPSSDPEAAAEEARFAEVSMKAIQVEPPPPEVKAPEPEPEIKPEAPAPQRLLKPTKMIRARSRAAPRPTGAQNALAALDMLKPADTASPLKDAVSNISAVSVPADARSRFKVGGAIGKLPLGEVRVSTAGVARDATSSSRELLSKDNVGALKGAGGSGNVRGIVKQTQNQLQAAGSGRLSRAQIQKVINEHVAQVQACYERNLMRDHSLSGKITFDWVIAPTGSVASVRVRSSTMAGSSVSTCILQEIRGWIFPTPEGGSVAVTYPFIFSAQGF